MTRRFTIVGLGEALLVERAEEAEAAGLSALIAITAARLGHAGVAVGRIGQDAPGDRFQALLTAAGVDTSHLQRDPDLPTGRIIDRGTGGRIARYLAAPAAFDNLQADFDLSDLAQEADAVVYGMLTRRAGQTRSEENRFLGTCAAALKVFDLTNRGAGEIERRAALSGLALADAAIVDRDGLDALRPGHDDRAVAERGAALQREAGLSFLLLAGAPAGDDGRASITVLSGEEPRTASIPPQREALAAFTVVLAEALLCGRAAGASIERGQRIAAHVVERPGEPIPPELSARDA